MPISLHSAIIPSMLQIIDAGKGWLNKAAASDLSETELMEARLVDDMLPFAYQIKSMHVHSKGAIEGLRAGVFSPDFSEPPATIAGLRERLEEAESFLAELSEDDLEGFVGSDMRFEVGEKRLDFTGDTFLTTFTQPNFFFHATTAYDILRAKGVPVGKLDYLGKMRLKA